MPKSEDDLTASQLSRGDQLLMTRLRTGGALTHPERGSGVERGDGVF